MSWGFLPDGHPEKYSTVQMAPGDELIDFVMGPLEAVDAHVKLFKMRIDPQHRGINPFFHERGTYRFVMQISALDTQNPEKLTIFIDWDGSDFVIRSDNPNRILEPAGVN